VYYVYGDNATGTWSEEGWFRAMLPAHPDREIFVALIADMGMTELDGTLDHWAEPEAFETASHVLDLVSAGDVDFVWHIGDLSYATGMESKWDLFNTRLHGISDRVPYMIGLGNHEADFSANASFPDQYFNSSDSGGECAMGTTTRFPMPTPDSHYSGWYNFTQGPATWIMLNSELNIDDTSRQYKYLSNTLAGVDRKRTPWVIVAFHRPMYFTDPNPEYDAHFALIEPLLYKYQVDLVLTGHVHNAMVTCPVLNQKCISPKHKGDYDAPVHVVTGNAGQPLTPIANATSEWVRYEASEFGYSTIQLNKTLLHMEFHRDSDNELHFEFDIVRNYPRHL
jgi:hypothetical protein